MDPPCPHCDQPDVTLLRLVLIGELLNVDDTTLLLLADLIHESGLLPRAAEGMAPESAVGRERQATLHALRQPGTHGQ